MAETPDKTAKQTSTTRSSSVTESIVMRPFLIEGYSLAKGMGVGKHIASEEFTVGGYKWATYFYPDGEDNSTYVSLFIALVSEGTDVRARFELKLLDQSGKAKHRRFESGPYTLKNRGSMWGYSRFYERATLETSDYLRDDCLKIFSTVQVEVPAIHSSCFHPIKAPDFDVDSVDDAVLLKNMEEGTDVDSVDGAVLLKNMEEEIRRQVTIEDQVDNINGSSIVKVMEKYSCVMVVDGFLHHIDKGMGNLIESSPFVVGRSGYSFSFQLYPDGADLQSHNFKYVSLFIKNLSSKTAHLVVDLHIMNRLFEHSRLLHTSVPKGFSSFHDREVYHQVAIVEPGNRCGRMLFYPVGVINIAAVHL